MEKQVEAGNAKAIGISNFSIKKVVHESCRRTCIRFSIDKPWLLKRSGCTAGPRAKPLACKPRR